MTYKDSVNWMFRQLPIYQNKGRTAYKEDLSNTVLLANHLNNPQTAFKSIHVAGTNGKGSTSHMLASILQEAGYKTGLYTSPHLKDFRERIRLNGELISKQFVMGFIRRNKSFFESNKLSFFEMTVGMAFEFFSKKKVDIAIIEVGLGGRLDSTNIITPMLSVITNIGFDHMEFLGHTKALIAKEKAGIIKSNTPVVIGETDLKTAPIFKSIADNQKAPIYFADELNGDSYDSDLKGLYQKHNIKTVVQAVTILRHLDFHIRDSHLRAGLLNVVKNTGIKGRWQILSHNPKVICDTAHNKEGLEYVFDQIKQESYNNLHIVFGTVKDKDLSSLLSVLPKNALYYFCKPGVARGRDAQDLSAFLKAHGYRGTVWRSVEEALTQAKNHAKNQDLIFVGGSTFVVAEII